MKDLGDIQQEHPGLVARFINDPDVLARTMRSVLGDLAWLSLPWLLGGLSVAVGASVVRRLLLDRRSQRIAAGASRLQIALPPETAVSGAEVFWTTVHDLLRPTWKRLVRGQPHLAFELIWQGPRLSVGIWVPESLPSALVHRAIEAAWPGSAVVTTDAEDLFAEKSDVLGGEFRLQRAEHFPISTKHDCDPLESIIAAVGELDSEQGAAVQIVARPVTGRRSASCVKAARNIKNGSRSTTTARILDWFGHQPPSKGLDLTRSADVTALVAKGSAPGFEVLVRYAVSRTHSPDAQSELKARAHSLASAFALFAGHNRFARRSLGRPRSRFALRYLGRGDLLSVGELATVAHLPAGVRLPGVERAGARVVAPAAAVPTAGHVLGESQGGTRRPVAVSAADGRYHFHVLGSTGSGKSTLLTNLILQDVEAERGAVVIDPKGDLVTDVLERLPRKAAERVTLLDPAHPEVLPALDVLAGEDENLVVDNIVGIFRRIFEANWGPRTDDVMRAACLTLTRSKLERPSLARVPLLLTDNAYRNRLTKNIGDPAGLGGFWASYEAMSDSQRSQVVGPLMNKLRSFLMREFVRTAIGPGSRPLDFARVLDGRLLLVRVPKGTLGDDTAKLIGSLVVAKVWQAALARANRQQSGRTDASLYVDECQNFLNLPRSFDEMLAEARGYGLSLVLAHQHLGQLGRELRDAISANARNKVYFSVSPEDARQLARHVGPELSEHDLSHLGSYQVALRPVVAGREERACTFKSRPSRPPSNADRRTVLDVLKADAQSASGSSDDPGTPLADWVRKHAVERDGAPDQSPDRSGDHS